MNDADVDLAASRPNLAGSTEPGRPWAWSRVGWLALGSTVAVWLGVSWSFWMGDGSPIWLASGLAVWGVSAGGPRVLWGVALGALLGKVLAGSPSAMLMPSAICAIGEAWFGARVLDAVRRRWRPISGAEESNILGTLAAAVLAPVWAVIFGVGALYALGILAPAQLIMAISTWWAGDLLGILILVPLLRIGVERDVSWAGLMGQERRGWGVAAFVTLALATWVVFVEPWGANLVFLVFPVLLLAVIWRGRFGVRLAALLITAVALIAVSLGRGPFVGGDFSAGLLRLYGFVAIVIATAWVLPLFRRYGDFKLPGMVLMIGWMLSGGVYFHERLLVQQDEANRLSSLMAQAETAIAQRMTIYGNALWAGQGLFEVKQDVSRVEWRRFVRSLRLAQRYPGINGIGVIWPVPETGVDTWVTAMRAGGRPDLTVRAVPGVTAPRPAPGEAAHYVIGYIEPESINAAAIGLDVGSEANRRRAANRARDTGAPMMTRRIVLVQDGKQRAGFLLFVPVYEVGPMPATLHERRAKFRHWIYAPFVTELFMQGVLPEGDRELDVDLFEGRSLAPEDLLYSSTGDTRSAYDATSEIELAGETFSLGWRRTTAFVSPDAALPVWISFGLALASLLLAGVVTLLQRSSKRAQALTEERTRELATTQRDLQRLLSLQLGVLDGNVFAIISTDRSGAIEIFNTGAERMLGYDRKTVVGRFTPEQFYVPREVEKRARAYAAETGRAEPAGFALFPALLSDERVHEQEWTLVRKDGTLLPVQVTLSAIRNALDEISGYLFIGQDVSERKAAEADRQAAVSELAAFKDALEHYVAMSISTVDGRIAYANDLFCSGSGYTREELIGGAYRRLKSDAHPPEFFAELWTTVRAGRLWRGAICNRARDGAHYWVDTLIFPELGANGRPRRYIVLQIDITQTKQLEENLERARDEAMTLSRLKSEFLANMSHELRTPMNGVIGMAELLEETPLDETQQQMASTIRSSGENLLTIINDVLDFSKIEAGKMRFEPADFDLRGALHEVVELLGPGAAAKKLTLREDLPDGDWAAVHGDEGRVRQVVTNLVGNAIKFTENGGVVLALQVRERTPAGLSFRVEVRDTGIGISPEAQARLFQAFVQVDGSDQRKFGGTGLGLAISRQIIEFMGGRVGLESTPGKGSVFWFELTLPPARDPLEAATPATPPVETKPDPMRRRLNILLVDDNPINRDVAGFLLRRMGHRFDVAVNGQDALDHLAREAYDAVLMDCQMPVMDGFEATRTIRAGSVPGIDPHVPVIALTAYVTDGDRKRCLDAGMDEHLTKPLRRPEVEAALTRFGRGGASSKEPERTAVGSADPVLDAEISGELIEIGGVETFASIAEAYLATSIAEMTILQRACSEADWATLGQRSHSLGSGAAAFGGVALQRQCLRLERAADEADARAVGEILAEVAEGVEALRVAVAAVVAAGSSPG